MYSGIPHLTSEDAGGIPIPLNKMEVASPFPISPLYIFIYVYIYIERCMMSMICIVFMMSGAYSLSKLSMISMINMIRLI